MRIETLIKKLEKIRKKYVDKNGVEPHIFDWNYETLTLCSKIKKYSHGVHGEKPLMEVNFGTDKITAG